MLLTFDQLDAVIDQVGGEVLDLLLAELDLLDALDDLVIGEEALLLSRGDELVEFLDVGKSNVDSEHLCTTSGYDFRWRGTTIERTTDAGSLLRLTSRRVTLHQDSPN